MRPIRFSQAPREETPGTGLQAAVLELLMRHPRVAWVRRLNTGAGRLGFKDKKTGEFKQSRFIRFGFKGCADIIGQEKHSGRFIAVECKAGDDELTDDQSAFLEGVRAAGGIAFVARDPVDVLRELGHGPAPVQASRRIA